jgi:hypothetical protein
MSEPASAPEQENPVVPSMGEWLKRHALQIVILFGAGLWFMDKESIDRNDSHYWRMVLAFVAIALLHFVWERRRKDASFDWSRPIKNKTRSVTARLLYAFWGVFLLFGVMNYYQFDKKTYETVGDFADATYYYINSKYFEELGYFELYRAMLVADAESKNIFKDVPKFRDLVEYERLLPRSVALADSERVKGLFSKQRWEDFTHDVNYVSPSQPSGGWRYFFIDHGYNPPPTWTLIGGTLSRLVPIEQIKQITMIDFYLVLLMFGVVFWTFGPATGLVAVAFFLVTFSGRWPMLGQAVLRFDWLCAVVIGVCMLKKERFLIAGALLGYAAWTRIFPGIFVFPYAVVFLRDCWKTRTIALHHRRFIMGMVGISVFIVGGALVVVGPKAFQDSFVNLKLHSSPESFSSHRVGLGDAAIYDGEFSKKDLRANGGIEKKRESLWRINPYLKFMGILSLIIIGMYIWSRREEKVYRLIWMGIFPLFILTNPQINYYNLRLLLILYHLEKPDRYRDRLGLYMLFAIEAFTQMMQVMGAVRYAVTATTSIGMVVYLGTMAFFLTKEHWETPDPDESDEDTAVALGDETSMGEKAPSAAAAHKETNRKPNGALKKTSPKRGKNKKKK